MITMRMKDLFFDRQKVIDMMDKKTHSALKKAGAFIQRVARQSIRRRKKPSAPGQPPSAHAKEGLKKILFVADRQSLIVGPVGFGPKPGVVPQTNEFGGKTEIRQHKWSADLREGKKLPPRGTKARVAARPFMGPALRKEVAQHGVSRWSASVRSS